MRMLADTTRGSKEFTRLLAAAECNTNQYVVLILTSGFDKGAKHFFFSRILRAKYDFISLQNELVIERLIGERPVAGVLVPLVMCTRFRQHDLPNRSDKLT